MRDGRGFEGERGVGDGGMEWGQREMGVGVKGGREWGVEGQELR